MENEGIQLGVGSRYLAISRTGVFHRALGPMSVGCNGKSAYVYPASEADYMNADDSKFCKKCFPEGKASVEQMKAKASV